MLMGLATFARHLALAGFVMLLATFVGVGMTGKSIAAGGRTAMTLIVVDLVLAVLAIVRFAVATRRFAPSGLARSAWTLTFAGAMATMLVVLVLMTLVVLNR